jgi:hypothetical protein
MSRAHAEIAHQTRRLGQLIEDIGPGEPDDTDVDDLRALLYGLHAILSLHTTQEEENYLSLGDDTRPAHPAAPGDERRAGPPFAGTAGEGVPEAAAAGDGAAGSAGKCQPGFTVGRLIH